MDMHSNLTIEIESFNGISKNIPVFKNLSDINFENKIDIIQIKEYTTFSINFEGVNSEKLYFDLFDLLDNNFEIDEKNNKYITNHKITFGQKGNINNVIVPGYYHLKVVGELIFHAVIEIIPKDLDRSEWRLMYEEIQNENEEFLNSFRNKTNSNFIKAKNRNLDYLNKINYLISNYEHLSNALTILKDNPRSTLEKKYSWINKNMSPPINNTSIKMHMKKPNKSDYIFSPKRYIEYNNKENRWLKHSLEKILFYLKDIKIETIVRKEKNEYLSKELIYKREVELNKSNSLEFDKILNIINKLETSLLILQNQEWYKSITNRDRSKISYGVLMNNNYRIIAKWVDNIYKKENTLIFNESIQYAWKRTDELYEIWCFIKLLKILIELDFKGVSGWVFDEDSDEINLREGTNILLKKNEVTLSMYFNSIIKSNSLETSINNPVYTTFLNNKPDIRIDVYIGDDFVKTIPIEVKYRKLNKIIFGEGNAIKQLKSYSYNLRSNYHYLSFGNIFRENQSILSELLVIYPQKFIKMNNQDYKTLTNDDRIEFLGLSPSYGYNHLKEKISTSINNLTEYYESFKR